MIKNKIIEQIKREISAVELIKHTNVVQLYEVMDNKKKIYIVFEFVSGRELFDKIVNHGILKEYEARRYFQQLINAFYYFHSKSVYHRDLELDKLNETKTIREFYELVSSGYIGKYNVMVLWDKTKKTIVNNEISEITHMLNTKV